MTENTMNKTSDTTAADLPPAPNGHGASNGTLQTDAAAEGSVKDAPSSRTNKKRQSQHSQKRAPARGESTAAAAAANQPASTEPAELARPTAPDDPLPLIEEPLTPLLVEPTAAPIEQHTANLRLRIKVWTDPTTTKRYLMPSAFMRNVLNGQPISDVMYAYAMRDDDTKLVTLTAGEWNALPFFYFQEDGPAPRATTRPVDVIVSREREP